MAKNWITDLEKKLNLILVNTEEKNKYISFIGERIRSLKNKLKNADPVEKDPKNGQKKISSNYSINFS